MESSELDIADGEELTVDKILVLTGKTEHSEVIKLNAFALDIVTIRNLDIFDNLEIISLSLNKITTLNPFSKCQQLRELHLRKNRIEDLAEIAYLAELPHLHTLLLSDNPCCSAFKYRLKVIRTLKSLRKLDSTVIADDEYIDSSCSGDSELIAFDTAVTNKVNCSQPIDDAVLRLEGIRSERHQKVNTDLSPCGFSNGLLAIRLLLSDLSVAETQQLMTWCVEKLEEESK